MQLELANASCNNYMVKKLTRAVIPAEKAPFWKQRNQIITQREFKEKYIRKLFGAERLKCEADRRQTRRSSKVEGLIVLDWCWADRLWTRSCIFRLTKNLMNVRSYKCGRLSERNKILKNSLTTSLYDSCYKIIWLLLQLILTTSRPKSVRYNNYDTCLFSKQIVVLRWWVSERKICLKQTNW